MDIHAAIQFNERVKLALKQNGVWVEGDCGEEHNSTSYALAFERGKFGSWDQACAHNADKVIGAIVKTLKNNGERAFKLVCHVKPFEKSQRFEVHVMTH